VIDKRVASTHAALDGVRDGWTIAVGGFGDSGVPFELLDELLLSGVRDLTIVCNNAGSGDDALARLLDAGRVRKIVCSFPRSAGSVVFERLYAAKQIELELVPQGTLSERLRAGGAGIPAFYTPAGASTLLAAGKESRRFGATLCVMEKALVPDLALVRAESADRWGNLTYHRAARNFGPVMAAASRLTVAQVDRILELGALDPEAIVTPGIFVDRVVAVVR